MATNPKIGGFSGSGNGVGLGNQTLSVLPNPKYASLPQFNDDDYLGGFLETGSSELRYPIGNGNLVPSAVHKEYSLEDCDFSDTVLNYISQILMEEDIEEKSCMLQESLDLQAAERPFYEALGKKYPPSPEPDRNYALHGDSLKGNLSLNRSNYVDKTFCDGEFVRGNGLIQHFGEYASRFHCVPPSSYSSSNSGISSVDGLLDSPCSSFRVPDFSSECQSMWQFRKGVEEASRFLPRNELCINLDSPNGISSQAAKIKSKDVSVKMENKDAVEYSKVRKKASREDEDPVEERSKKLPSTDIESTLRSKMFDLVLLCGNGDGAKHLSTFRKTLNNGHNEVNQKTGQSKGSNGGKGRGKKPSAKKEVIDLRTLLIQCAQAVAAGDNRSANELLKHIRQHSLSFGDGNQRLANCFADGLEARLAGTGSEISKGILNRRTCASDMLKAYLLYLAACPFRKMSNFASNKTIMNVSAKATTVHVIDFGILYGFQWPTLMQRIAAREGGPPKIRITGIEFPQPGFKPAERVEETGRRLKTYADTFKVQFEYTAIAKKWETITLEELKIDKDEFIVVNCLNRAKNLLDESITVESPRNMFLNLVKKINPDIFIHGIVNGAYNAPFFVTRFREALFHFSAIFDMLETIVPRGELERMLIEREVFGKEALNVIACEGWERVERPETYKQWQIRIMRAGFVQQPLDRDIVKRATEKVRTFYHRDFIIDEDSGWLLQGWKGRIIFALSLWKPAER